MLNGKIKYIIYITFATNLLVANVNYQIYLWNLNIAEVNIKISEVNFDNFEAKKIIYKANTKGLYNHIYQINNLYEVIIDKKNGNILSYKKIIDQPDQKDTLSTIRINNKTNYYRLKQYEIKSESLNIFTLIYFLINQSIRKIINKKLMLEREGDEFECIVKNHDEKQSDLYQIIINSKKLNNYKEKTDIFSWALFKSESIIKVWLNKKDNLYKCEFKSGLLTFIAKKSN